MKILLIDNHALFREGLRQILRQLPGGVYEILEAGDLAGGLKLAGQHPDLGLVLLELNSHGNEGAISVKLFRQRYPHIPVVVVSCEEDCDVMRKALNYGASGFVGKSTTGAKLLDAVARALSGGNDGCRSNTHEYSLTARQMNILKHLAAGLSDKDIARVTGLTEGTVKVHVAAVRRILHVKNRVEAVLVAEYLGLTGC